MYKCDKAEFTKKHYVDIYVEIAWTTYAKTVTYFTTFKVLVIFVACSVKTSSFFFDLLSEFIVLFSYYVQIYCYGFFMIARVFFVSYFS